MQIEKHTILEGISKRNLCWRKKSYDRQMILGDMLQYIFTGRGYCFALKDSDYFKDYIRILMRIANLMLLMEDISVDVTLRNKVLNDLDLYINEELFEDMEQKQKFNSLRQYTGKIVPNQGKDHEVTFDSILPKRIGGVPEILVYAYLIRKNYGYVVPLLQAQRLLGKMKSITPPDFLLLRSKGEVFGIEVGSGKEQQISSFSNVVSTPIFSVGIGDLRTPQPYRCAKCQRWITYCDEIIEQCATNQDSNKKFIDCTQCSKFDSGNCQFIVYYGKAHDHNNEIKKRRYHYRCVRNDQTVIDSLARARSPKLIAPFPWLTGLEYVTEE